MEPYENPYSGDEEDGWLADALLAVIILVFVGVIWWLGKGGVYVP